MEITYQRSTNDPDVITQLESSPDLIDWTEL